MARGELLGAFALSEPEAGSDAASLRTPGRARRRRLDPQRHQGVGVERHQGRSHRRHGAHRFARGSARRARHQRVHRHAGPAGLSASARRKTRWGCARRRRCSSTSTDMRVPGDRLLGAAGQRIHLRDAVARQRAARHRGAGDRHRRGGAARTRSPMRRSASSSASRSRNSRRFSSSSPTWRRAIASARALLHAVGDREGSRRAHHAVQRRWPSCSRARRRCG